MNNVGSWILLQMNNHNGCDLISRTCLDQQNILSIKRKSKAHTYQINNDIKRLADYRLDKKILVILVIRCATIEP